MIAFWSLHIKLALGPLGAGVITQMGRWSLVLMDECISLGLIRVFPKENWEKVEG